MRHSNLLYIQGRIQDFWKWGCGHGELILSLPRLRTNVHYFCGKRRRACSLSHPLPGLAPGVYVVLCKFVWQPSSPLYHHKQILIFSNSYQYINNSKYETNETADKIYFKIWLLSRCFCGTFTLALLFMQTIKSMTQQIEIHFKTGLHS